MCASIKEQTLTISCALSDIYGCLCPNLCVIISILYILLILYLREEGGNKLQDYYSLLFSNACLTFADESKHLTDLIRQIPFDFVLVYEIHLRCLLD